MKAAVFEAPGRIEIQDLPVPEPAPGEVRIKVLGCGVCGTDAHICSGDIRNAEPPVVLGHEIFGRIDKLTETAFRRFTESRDQEIKMMIDPWV